MALRSNCPLRAGRTSRIAWGLWGQLLLADLTVLLHRAARLGWSRYGASRPLRTNKTEMIAAAKWGHFVFCLHPAPFSQPKSHRTRSAPASFCGLCLMSKNGSQQRRVPERWQCTQACSDGKSLHRQAIGRAYLQTSCRRKPTR